MLASTSTRFNTYKPKLKTFHHNKATNTQGKTIGFTGVGTPTIPPEEELKENIRIQLKEYNLENGSDRFNENDIKIIDNKVNFHNKYCLDILLKAKNQNRFDAYWIAKILSKINSQNKDKLNELLEAKDDENKNRFNGLNMLDVFCNINTDNKDCLNILLKAKDKKNKDRFSPHGISRILGAITLNNKDSLDILLDAQEGTINYSNIADMLFYINQENKKILYKLIKVRDAEEYRFNGTQVKNMLTNYKPE